MIKSVVYIIQRDYFVNRSQFGNRKPRFMVLYRPIVNYTRKLIFKVRLVDRDFVWVVCLLVEGKGIQEGRGEDVEMKSVRGGRKRDREREKDKLD